MPGAACLFFVGFCVAFFGTRSVHHDYILYEIGNSCGRKHLSNYQIHELKSEHMKFTNILENSLDYE